MFGIPIDSNRAIKYDIIQKKSHQSTINMKYFCYYVNAILVKCHSFCPGGFLSTIDIPDSHFTISWIPNQFLIALVLSLKFCITYK